MTLPQLRNNQPNLAAENLYAEAWLKERSIERDRQQYLTSQGCRRAFFHMKGPFEVLSQALQSMQRIGLAAIHTTEQLVTATRHSLQACRRRKLKRLPPQAAASPLQTARKEIERVESKPWPLAAASALHLSKAILETPLALSSGLIQLAHPLTAFKIRRMLQSGDLHILRFEINQNPQSIRVICNMQPMQRTPSRRALISGVDVSLAYGENGRQDIREEALHLNADLRNWRVLSRSGPQDLIPDLNAQQVNGIVLPKLSRSLTPSEILDMILEGLEKQILEAQS